MTDEDVMRLALAQAEMALGHSDVPVGAVAVHDGSVIASSHNRREQMQDPIQHAELTVIQAAAQVLGGWRLDGVSIYVTLEPCVMCAGALVAARVGRLIYGAADPKAGAAYSLYNVVQDPRLNHKCELTAGVLAEESDELLTRFFRTLRGGPPE